jgi:hypothetical protein
MVFTISPRLAHSFSARVPNSPDDGTATLSAVVSTDIRSHSATASPSARPAALPENPKVSWDRITIRLTRGELEKINDVVIATQQANRWGRVTTTDILRVALRRVKDQEAIDVWEIKVLRARDGRFTKV